jgi:16S rRNA (cytosine967-C5)-methyltransferase
MRMNERMDEGDILLQRPTPIGAEETYGALQTRLAEIGAAALMDALDASTAGTLTPAPQDHARATLAPMISKAQGAIDWRDSATLIERRVRAFNPWPSAYTTLRGKLLKIHVARVETGPGEAGRIVDVSDAIRVATGDGILAIESLQLEGRKAMGAIEFAHGGALAAGEQLGAQAPPAEPRRLAWRVLTAVEDGAFADAVLGSTLRGAHLDPRDRALATQLVYGTLAWQGLLDHVLARLGREPRRLDADVRTLLRLALFQIVKLDRVPEFAAVDTAVDLAKTIKGGAPSGLVNAILRRFLREGRSLELPPESDRARHLAVATSHPRWLVERWLAELGPDDASALLASDNDPAPTTLRVLTTRGSREHLIAALADVQVAARPTQYAADGLILESAADPIALPGWREGWFTVQGEASQLVAAMLGAAPGARVLDVCAAPGGKALAAAGTVGAAGLTVALDPHHAGLARLRAEAGRLGLRVARVPRRRDPTAARERRALRRRAGRCAVLRPRYAAPASRDPLAPSAGGRRRARGATDTSPRRRLFPRPSRRNTGLRHLHDLTRGERRRRRRLSREHAEFSPENPRPFLPEPAHDLIDTRGALRTFPHRHRLDGFFALRMKRVLREPLCPLW